MVFKKLARRKAANKPTANQEPAVVKEEAAPAPMPVEAPVSEPIEVSELEPIVPTSPAETMDQAADTTVEVSKDRPQVPDPLINVLLKQLIGNKPKKPSEDIEEEINTAAVAAPMAMGCGPGLISGLLGQMASFSIVEPLQSQIVQDEVVPGSPEKARKKELVRQLTTDVALVELDSSIAPAASNRPASSSDASSSEEEDAIVTPAGGAWEKRQAKVEKRKAKREQKVLARQQKKEKKEKKKAKRKAAKAAKVASKKINSNSRAHQPVLTAEAP